MQILDWVLLALVVFAAALAVRKITRDRRAGKCCGNCAGCAAHCDAARSDAGRAVPSDAACPSHAHAANTAHCAQNTNNRVG